MKRVMPKTEWTMTSTYEVESNLGTQFELQQGYTNPRGFKCISKVGYTRVALIVKVSPEGSKPLRVSWISKL